MSQVNFLLYCAGKRGKRFGTIDEPKLNTLSLPTSISVFFAETVRFSNSKNRHVFFCKIIDLRISYI